MTAKILCMRLDLVCRINSTSESLQLKQEAIEGITNLLFELPPALAGGFHDDTLIGL